LFIFIFSNSSFIFSLDTSGISIIPITFFGLPFTKNGLLYSLPPARGTLTATSL
jgi:hypothetical protein